MRTLGVAFCLLTLAACDPPRDLASYKTVPITPFLGEPSIGKADAPVTLTEYASTTCSHCKAFHDEAWPQLKAKYVDTGKVRLVWAVMPTPPAGVSMAGAAIARCAGEQRFFAVLDVLFDRQPDLLAAAREPRRLQEQLIAIGGQFGLGPDQVGTCLDDKAIALTTQQGVLAAPPEITGTPSFMIDGRKIEDKTLAGLSAAIDERLRQEASPAGGDGH